MAHNAKVCFSGFSGFTCPYISLREMLLFVAFMALLTLWNVIWYILSISLLSVTRVEHVDHFSGSFILHQHTEDTISQNRCLL